MGSTTRPSQPKGGAGVNAAPSGGSPISEALQSHHPRGDPCSDAVTRGVPSGVRR